MVLAPSVAGLFKWRQFEPEVILLAVGWYLRFSLSYRDVEELLAERGISVDHVTLWRWVQRYAPELERRLRNGLKATNDSWRVDETYVRVKANGCTCTEPWILRVRRSTSCSLVQKVLHAIILGDNFMWRIAFVSLWETRSLEPAPMLLGSMPSLKTIVSRDPWTATLGSRCACFQSWAWPLKTQVSALGKWTSRAPATNARVPAGEPTRWNSAPIQQLQHRPMQPHEREIALFESAWGGYDPAVQMDKTTDSAQTPEQVQIFEKWQWTEAANLVIDVPPDKDTWIAVA
jgi:hypothetical protein